MHENSINLLIALLVASFVVWALFKFLGKCKSKTSLSRLVKHNKAYKKDFDFMREVNQYKRTIILQSNSEKSNKK